MKIALYLFLSSWSLWLLGQSTPQLLIVTTQEFASVAQTMQSTKQSYGLATAILYSESVNALPSPEELLEAMRHRQQHFSFDHVLLLGDAQHIPPFQGIQDTWHDHGYSLADDEDFLPDWAVGRLPFANATAAQVWWDRQQTKRIPGYDGGHALVSVSALNRDDEEGVSITESLEAKNFSVSLFRQTQQTHDGQLVLQQLQEGTPWAIYYGHGNEAGWNSLDPGISSTQVGAQPLAEPTVVLSAACDNANFVYAKGRSLGESFLDAGAASFTGCTGECLYDYSDTVTKRTLFRYLEADHRTLGEALRLAKLDLYAAFHQQSMTFTELTCQHFVLLGDPTAMPPVKTLQQPSYRVDGDQYCLNESQLLWGYQQDTTLVQRGYANMEGHCLAVSPGGTLGVIGRHMAQALWPIAQQNPKAHLYPNPVTAHARLQWVTDQPVIQARWIALNGQEEPVPQPTRLTAPDAGAWILEWTLADGSTHQQKVIVLP